MTFSNRVLKLIQEDYTLKIKNKVILENMKYIIKNDKDPDTVGILKKQLSEHPLQEEWF